MPREMGELSIKWNPNDGKFELMKNNIEDDETIPLLMCVVDFLRTMALTNAKNRNLILSPSSVQLPQKPM